jgi:purine-binding chemotaxis protein CheW
MNAEHEISNDGARQVRPGLQAKQTQYTTFVVGGHLYGVPVIRVREVVRPLPLTSVPLAIPFVHGLLNLRGQVVTAIGIHRLFNIGCPDPMALMNVICESGSTLISLQADEIGDVLEMDAAQMEHPPANTREAVRSYLAGVYKMPKQILSIIDIDHIFEKVNATSAQ